MSKAFLHIGYKVAALANNEGEIRIFDQIGQETDWWTGETYGISAKAFIDDLKALEAKHDVIHIRVNSIGGYLSDGLAMFNAVASSTKDIKVHNDGIAYSFGAAFLQSAKKGNRYAGKSSMTMLHAVAGSPYGLGRLTAAKAREVAAELDKFDAVMAEAMSASIGLSKEEIQAKWLDGKDHYFTAEEAKAAGLIDHIEGDVEATAIGDNYKIEQVLPMRIAALSATEDKGGFVAFVKNQFKALEEKISALKISHSNKTEMNLATLAAKFEAGTAVTISAEESAQFKALLAQYNEAKFTQAEVEAKVNESVTAKATELQGTIADLQARLDAAGPITKPVAGAKPEGGVENPDAVVDGTVTAEAKAEWEKAQAKKNKK